MAFHCPSFAIYEGTSNVSVNEYELMCLCFRSTCGVLPVVVTGGFHRASSLHMAGRYRIFVLLPTPNVLRLLHEPR